MEAKMSCSGKRIPMKDRCITVSWSRPHSWPGIIRVKLSPMKSPLGTKLPQRQDGTIRDRITFILSRDWRTSLWVNICSIIARRKVAVGAGICCWWVKIAQQPIFIKSGLSLRWIFRLVLRSISRHKCSTRVSSTWVIRISRCWWIVKKWRNLGWRFWRQTNPRWGMKFSHNEINQLISDEWFFAFFLLYLMAIQEEQWN